VPRTQERSLTDRFQTALGRVVERYPAAFQGTDLDPERNRAALEALCQRVEALLEAAPAAASELSPAEILASRLREALASNTMGARVDPAVQRRADAERVRQAQAECRTLGVVPGEAGRQLSDRFRRACDRFFEKFPPPPQDRSRPRGDDRSRRRPRPGPGSGDRA